MKFETGTQELLTKLTRAIRFTSSQLTNIPSLQGSVLKCDKKSLTISTTNLNDFYSTKISVNVIKKGSVIFDIKKAVEFLNLVDEKKVDVELKEKKLLIKTKKTKGSFNVFSEEDYPTMPKGEGKKAILSSKLLERLPFVIFSASRDESRPVLTGIFFKSLNNETHIVSTDGFRLSLISVDKKEMKIPEFILSSRFLSELLSMIKDKNKVDLLYSSEEKTATFKVGDDLLITRTIEGDFPPYEKVIPEKYKTRFIIDREEFLKKVKLIAVFARDLSNVITLEINKNGMNIRPKTSGDEEAEVFQEIHDFEGDDIKTSFNYRFVLDLLNNIKTKTIVIELNGSAAPGVFKPEGKKYGLHIIMPLRTENVE